MFKKIFEEFSGKPEKQESEAAPVLLPVPEPVPQPPPVLPTEQALPELSYDVILRERAKLYNAHVSKMDVVIDIKLWAGRMAARFGTHVKVWHNLLPWTEALLVTRYGEDSRHWPKAFAAKDLERARQWELGRIPAGVKNGVL